MNGHHMARAAQRVSATTSCADEQRLHAAAGHDRRCLGRLHGCASGHVVRLAGGPPSGVWPVRRPGALPCVRHLWQQQAAGSWASGSHIAAHIQRHEEHRARLRWAVPLPHVVPLPREMQMPDRCWLLAAS